MIYSVESAASGQRLDVWLAEASGLSRSQVAKLIKAGQVIIDGRPATAAKSVAAQQKIEVRSLINETPAAPSLIDLSSAVEIIAATDEYVVVNKPAGMITHYPPIADKLEPRRSPSLADWLVRHFPQADRVGEDPSRPGIVHRLDKQVSGLLVLALSADSFDNLKHQFQTRKVLKKYQVLVHGSVSKDEAILDFRLSRSSDGSKMAAKPLGSLEGKRAITEIKVMRRLINYTLLEVVIKTGRTHQIRAHLAAYGHPVVGDTIYGTAATKRLATKLKLKRLFLVSCQLSFRDLSGALKNFQLPLPQDLTELLNSLK